VCRGTADDHLAYQTSIFIFLAVQLRSFLELDTNNRPARGPDFLFYTAAIYANEFLSIQKYKPTEHLQRLLIVIQDYKAYVGERRDIEKLLGVDEDYIGQFWDVLRVQAKYLKLSPSLDKPTLLPLDIEIVVHEIQPADTAQQPHINGSAQQSSDPVPTAQHHSQAQAETTHKATAAPRIYELWQPDRSTITPPPIKPPLIEPATEVVSETPLNQHPYIPEPPPANVEVATPSRRKPLPTQTVEATVPDAAHVYVLWTPEPHSDSLPPPLGQAHSIVEEILNGGPEVLRSFGLWPTDNQADTSLSEEHASESILEPASNQSQTQPSYDPDASQIDYEEVASAPGSPAAVAQSVVEVNSAQDFQLAHSWHPRSSWASWQPESGLTSTPLLHGFDSITESIDDQRPDISVLSQAHRNTDETASTSTSEDSWHLWEPEPDSITPPSVEPTLFVPPMDRDLFGPHSSASD